MDYVYSDRLMQLNTLGLFDPLTFEMSFHSLEEVYKGVKRDEKKLQRVAIQEQMGAIPYSEYQTAVWKHQEKFDLYYRVRTHEKAHWYTFVSSSMTISQLFVYGDRSYDLHSALKYLAEQTELPILLPLVHLLATDQCPSEVLRPILAYISNRLINAALDGLVLELHFDGDEHILCSHFPDLRGRGRFWDTPSYRTGVRALVEGAGKAAEWLYVLMQDRSLESKAWEDIRGSPPIYAEALGQLTKAITGLSLLEYLQLLVVLIDFSLNPYIPKDSWPYLLGGGRKGEDALPGFRFQRLLDLVKRYPRIDVYSKENIASFLESSTAEIYGWETSSQVTSQVLELTKPAVFLHSGFSEANEKYFSNLGEPWNPIETIRSALAIKMQAPLAYVPPINAEAINASETYPPIELIAGVNAAVSPEVALVHFVMALQAILLDDVVNRGLLSCPLFSHAWMSKKWRKKGWCKLTPNICSSGMSDAKNWHRLRRCEFYELLLAYFFDGAVNRIQRIS